MGEDAERQHLQDAFKMSDDTMVMLETPMPHMHSRLYVADTPLDSIVALLFLVLANQSLQWILAPQSLHSQQ